MKKTVSAYQLLPGDLVVGIGNADWHFPPTGVRIVSVEEVERGAGILILFEGEGKRKELWSRYETWFIETDEEQERAKDRFDPRHPKFCLRHGFPDPCPTCGADFEAKVAADPIASEMNKLLEPEPKPKLTREEFEERQKQARIQAPAQTHADQLTIHWVHAPRQNPQMVEVIKKSQE